MKPIAAIFAALLTVGAAHAGTRTVPITPITEAPRNCPLTVSFGSYAMGIDGKAFDAVSGLLTRDRGVKAVEQYRWGREGEVTLCARTRGGADARRLFWRVRALFPRAPRGPLTVSTASGLRFAVSRR
jgi:hypothetical protein